MGVRVVGPVRPASLRTHARGMRAPSHWISATPVLRCFPFIFLVGLLTIPQPSRAASSSFDLIGPHLAVTVTHDGVTLPLERIPNLTEGDQVSIKLDRSNGSGERYRFVAAFLRGAVDRPPKEWFQEAESWKPKFAELSLVVPKGAQQLALLITPERGGSGKAIIGTILKQPGAFVRAVQELDQASLDRTRLDAFLREMQQAERKNPNSVASVSPILTRSLAIKLKAECLQQVAEVQAACLTGDRETLLLADSHSSALADTVTGAPTDLALQLSATPQAGYGAYSSYIGVVRDVFRLFGAFQSTQLQFIPALAQLRDGQVTVLLNTPLSFAKPASVMVVALPLVEAPTPPPMRNPDPGKTLCATPGLVLPVEGAPLVFATGYAHDMSLRFPLADGSQTAIPVHADASIGGFVLDGAIPAGAFAPATEGHLHGNWGFAPFDGPGFQLSRPGSDGWKAAEHMSLVVGRANDVELLGADVGCVTQVAMRRGDGPVQPVVWKQSGLHGIVATLPLEKAEPGSVSILVDGIGRAAPAVVTVPALREVGSLDDLDFHAGDEEAVLSGARLDQVSSAILGGVTFQPGALTRVGKTDRLTLQANDPTAARALAASKTLSADITFTGGRHKTLGLTVAPPKTSVALVRVSAQLPVRDHFLPITLSSERVFAQEARLAFAFHVEGPAPLTGRETVEVSTADGRADALIQAGKGYDLQDTATGIVAFVPAEALGPIGFGALRFRVLRDGVPSGWTPLATVVRLPEIRTASCARKACTLTGARLFLIKTLGATSDFRDPQEIPDGFVASELTTRASPDGRIFLRLRDASQAEAFVSTR